MDITMIGLQNAGKTSLLRVLAVCSKPLRVHVSADRGLQGGEFTIE
jgi:ABC-type phosphate/phosphonate transport system ATPase subunit